MKRISSKFTILALILGLALFGALMTGCEKPAPVDGPDEPMEESVIIIGTTDKVTDLDPGEAYDFYTWDIFNDFPWFIVDTVLLPQKTWIMINYLFFYFLRKHQLVFFNQISEKLCMMLDFKRYFSISIRKSMIRVWTIH